MDSRDRDYFEDLIRRTMEEEIRTKHPETLDVNREEKRQNEELDSQMAAMLQGFGDDLHLDSDNESADSEASRPYCMYETDEDGFDSRFCEQKRTNPTKDPYQLLMKAILETFEAIPLESRVPMRPIDVVRCEVTLLDRNLVLRALLTLRLALVVAASDRGLLDDIVFDDEATAFSNLNDNDIKLPDVPRPDAFLYWLACYVQEQKNKEGKAKIPIALWRFIENNMSISKSRRKYVGERANRKKEKTRSEATSIIVTLRRVLLSFLHLTIFFFNTGTSSGG